MKLLQYSAFLLVLFTSSSFLLASNNKNVPLDLVLEKAFNTNLHLSDSLLNAKLESLGDLETQDKFWVLFNKLTSDYVCGIYELDIAFITQQSLPNEIKTLLVTTLKLDRSISLTDLEIQQLKTVKRRENLFYYLVAQFNLGRASALNNELKKAISFLEHTAKGSRRTSKKFLESRSLFELGRLYYSEGMLERAYAFSQKALRKTHSNNEQTWESLCLNQLGDIQLETGNYNVAKDFFSDAYRLSTSLNLLRIKAISLSNLGQIYIQEKHYLEAIKSLQEALSFLYHLNDEYEIANVHLRIGASYFNVNKYDLARDNYTLGLNIVSKLNNELVMAKFHHQLGQLYIAADEFEKAHDHIHEAIAIRKQKGAYLQLSNSYTLAANLYANLKQFDKAFHFLLQQKGLTDSLQAVDLQRKISELNSIFQTEHKEMLILEQQKELEQKTNEQLLKDQELENIDLRNRQLYFLIIAILLFFIIVFIYVSFKNNQQKLQQEHKALELQQTIFRSQMNPHFIFNAMSVIQSYIYENDIPKSSSLLVNFSKLMRLILENSSKKFIPLSLELEILERYLNVQKIRFENRFNFEITTDNIDNIERVGIPPMLMQPFIENAIEHGNLHQIEKGLIIIKVELEKGLIVLTIQDNGIGVNKAKELKKATKHKSMALSITQERINLLNKEYGADGYMQINDLSEIEESGTKVVIKTVYKSNFFQE